MKIYEGMFLMDPALSSDWVAVETEVNRVLKRASAEVIGMRNWDERKLSYPISRHKRGLYVLSYFRADPEKLVDLERDVQLSEQVLRALFLRRDKMTEEQVALSLAAEPPKPPSRYDDRGGRFGERGGRFGDRGDRPDRGGRGGDRGGRPGPRDSDSRPPATAKPVTEKSAATEEKAPEKATEAPTTPAGSESQG